MLDWLIDEFFELRAGAFDLLMPLKERISAYWDGVWWKLAIIGFVVALGFLWTYGFFEKEAR